MCAVWRVYGIQATSGLRIIPNLDVIRPADPEEVAGAFAASIDRKNGPTALIFSRQVHTHILPHPYLGPYLGTYLGT